MRCGGHEGPFVDTLVDKIGDGRFYICTRVCLPIFAGLAGYLTPEQAAEARSRIEEARARVATLEAELEHERDHKFVSINDMTKLIESRATSTTKRKAAA